MFSSGLDLDNLFVTRTGTDPSTALVPFVTPSGQNLSARYLPYTTGLKASVTGFKFYGAGGVIKDLCDIYAQPPYTFTSGTIPSSVTQRKASSAGVTFVSLTFLSMDSSFAFLGNTSSTYNAGTFIVYDSTKIQDLKIVLVSGGGGAGCATTVSAAGGGGGAVVSVDASFVNNTILNVNVGNGGIGAFFSSADATGYPASRGGESRVTVGSGTAIINNVNYTTNQSYTATNNANAGTYGTISVFDLASGSPRSAGAGAGGGGGAYSNFTTGTVQGGAGNGSGSDGGDSSTPNTTFAHRAQPSGGGGGGGASAPANTRLVSVNNSNPSVFSGNGGGAPGSNITTHAVFGSTFYGGGGGAAQPSNTNSDASIGPPPFVMAGTGGQGGGGAAFRTETGVQNASGGSGTNGLGGGGGGVSAPITGTWDRTGGNGGHGTVIINFRLA